MIEMIQDKQQQQSQQHHTEELVTVEEQEANTESAKVVLWRQAFGKFETALENDPHCTRARHGLQQLKRLLVRTTLMHAAATHITHHCKQSLSVYPIGGGSGSDGGGAEG